jgi:hypothetical protein
MKEEFTFLKIKTIPVVAVLVANVAYLGYLTPPGSSEGWWDCDYSVYTAYVIVLGLTFIFSIASIVSVLLAVVLHSRKDATKSYDDIDLRAELHNPTGGFKLFMRCSQFFLYLCLLVFVLSFLLAGIIQAGIGAPEPTCNVLQCSQGGVPCTADYRVYDEVSANSDYSAGSGTHIELGPEIVEANGLSILAPGFWGAHCRIYDHVLWTPDNYTGCVHPIHLNYTEYQIDNSFDVPVDWSGNYTGGPPMGNQTSPNLTLNGTVAFGGRGGAEISTPENANYSYYANSTICTVSVGGTFPDEYQYYNFYPANANASFLVARENFFGFQPNSSCKVPLVGDILPEACDGTNCLKQLNYTNSSGEIVVTNPPNYGGPVNDPLAVKTLFQFTKINHKKDRWWFYSDFPVKCDMVGDVPHPVLCSHNNTLDGKTPKYLAVDKTGAFITKRNLLSAAGVVVFSDSGFAWPAATQVEQAVIALGVFAAALLAAFTAIMFFYLRTHSKERSSQSGFDESGGGAFLDPEPGSPRTPSADLPLEEMDGKPSSSSTTPSPKTIPELENDDDRKPLCE